MKQNTKKEGRKRNTQRVDSFSFLRGIKLKRRKTMSVPANGNYCMQCDANGDDDYNDAYKYVNDMNQLRDTVIGYGKI